MKKLEFFFVATGLFAFLLTLLFAVFYKRWENLVQIILCGTIGVIAQEAFQLLKFRWKQITKEKESE